MIGGGENGESSSIHRQPNSSSPSSSNNGSRQASASDGRSSWAGGDRAVTASKCRRNARMADGLRLLFELKGKDYKKNCRGLCPRQRMWFNKAKKP